MNTSFEEIVFFFLPSPQKAPPFPIFSITNHQSFSLRILIFCSIILLNISYISFTHNRNSVVIIFLISLFTEQYLPKCLVSICQNPETYTAKIPRHGIFPARYFHYRPLFFQFFLSKANGI